MKKNLVKKAVLPALAALVCSVIALTSVSYAWFTMGDTAEVNGMSMQVTGADGLQISSSGAADSFKSTLDFSSSLAMTNVNPSSTSGTLSDGALTFYTLQIVDGQNKNTTIATNNTDGKYYYIMFEFYVKVSAGKDLQLTSASVVDSEASANKETDLASRVAFVHLGSHLTPAGAQALNGSDVSGTAKIWEPNSRTRATEYKNSVSTEIYNQTKDQQLKYKGVSGIGTNTVPTLSDDIDAFDFDSSTDFETLFSLGEGYNKIRVYIWLEGQDIDCVNGISGGTFTVKLHFQQANTPTQP